MNFFSWCHVVFMFYYVTCSHDLLLNCIYIYICGDKENIYAHEKI